MAQKTAAIVTVGSELTEGLRIDTNTAEIARALSVRGFRVIEAVSVGDCPRVLAEVLGRLTSETDLVVTTGGLGPTHDDITREAAARALGVALARDDRLVGLLRPFSARHTDSRAAEQIFVQADVLPGARVIDPTTGTAPGLVADTRVGLLALLPGPPSEMRPMLEAVLGGFEQVYAPPRELGVVGMSESDVQVAAQDALAGSEGIGFTVLASPGDVRVLLFDHGAGAGLLGKTADAVAERIGDAVYSTRGESLAETVVRAARDGGVHVAAAESCTGGMVCGALTDVAGASDVVLGGVVAYANQAKIDLLDVPPGLLAQYGAVSQECAKAMAEGARACFGADVAVAVTGIAGPDGGTADKPVGLVWFGLADRAGSRSEERRFPGSSRDAVRARATAVALDLVRRAVLDR